MGRVDFTITGTGIVVHARAWSSEFAPTLGAATTSPITLWDH